ncbi:hypothetical protein EAI_15994 [Harpegnathos saltator]|uniref:Uncharacterized protein n=1 Tax=Harpegnathos saltator TaxID=610380 RepID=E2BG42_HARSA|nr:hypothetical protein EAI_15994 [Harpegnathos saltator]
MADLIWLMSLLERCSFLRYIRHWVGSFGSLSSKQAHLNDLRETKGSTSQKIAGYISYASSRPEEAVKRQIIKDTCRSIDSSEVPTNSILLAGAAAMSYRFNFVTCTENANTIRDVSREQSHLFSSVFTAESLLFDVGRRGRLGRMGYKRKERSKVRALLRLNPYVKFMRGQLVRARKLGNAGETVAAGGDGGGGGGGGGWWVDRATLCLTYPHLGQFQLLLLIGLVYCVVLEAEDILGASTLHFICYFIRASFNKVVTNELVGKELAEPPCARTPRKYRENWRPRNSGQSSRSNSTPSCRRREATFASFGLATKSKTYAPLEWKRKQGEAEEKVEEEQEEEEEEEEEEKEGEEEEEGGSRKVIGYYTILPTDMVGRLSYSYLGSQRVSRGPTVKSRSTVEEEESSCQTSKWHRDFIRPGEMPSDLSVSSRKNRDKKSHCVMVLLKGE